VPSARTAIFRQIAAVVMIACNGLTVAWGSAPDKGRAGAPVPHRQQAVATQVPAHRAKPVTVAHGNGGHRHGHFHSHGPSVRVWVGPPLMSPYPYWYQPYPPPYIYRPSPPVVVLPPAAPPVYIEREDVPRAPPSSFWYWCESRSAYHPQAPECPEGWIAVPPIKSGAQ
jgi:hypothetical protein